ncbi:MAG: hypothetical protein RL095_478 [Verrucomicrobiota bacterium]|jgi:hypothetical protein
MLAEIITIDQNTAEVSLQTDLILFQGITIISGVLAVAVTFWFIYWAHNQLRRYIFEDTGSASSSSVSSDIPGGRPEKDWPKIANTYVGYRSGIPGIGAKHTKNHGRRKNRNADNIPF